MVSKFIKENLKRIYYNFKFDSIFLSTRNISFFERVLYIFTKYYSILSNKRNIKYLGKTFFYDNRFVPVILQQYPSEISKIKTYIPLDTLSNVLDIGANIGQWAFTLKKFYPRLKIYSFEPNKEVFNILKRNSGNVRDWYVYNYGISQKTSKRKLHYSPEASAEASFYQENLDQNYTRSEKKEIIVDTIALDVKQINKLNLPNKYDLVKIDVEGAEMEVLKSLKNINFDYLYIEVSVKRKSDGNLDNILDWIKNNKKIKPIILNYSLPDKNSPCAEVIIKL